MTAYAATMIIAPPALEPEAVAAELLPLAVAAGFADVSISHAYSPALGHRYSAHALRGPAERYAAVTLADGFTAHTPEQLRHQALESLYHLAGPAGGTL